MTMRTKIARLFTIKTRLEAFLVTYAIAVGAVERGIHYTQNYPGNGGMILAIACLGVPFIAGAKLLDSVRPAEAISGSGPAGRIVAQRRAFPRRVSHSRPKDRRTLPDLESPSSRRTD